MYLYYRSCAVLPNRQAEPLLIKQIAAEVSETLAAGHRVINLSQGVPCLPVPDCARAAMTRLATSS